MGGEPLICHIVKQYESHGSSDFFVALGYKGELVKCYVLEYNALSGSINVSRRHGNVASLASFISIGT